MTPKEAKEFLREFLGDKPNFREERPGQDEEVYRQMDMLAEAIDMAISALGKDTDVPSKDTISRRDAINAAVKGADPYYKDSIVEELMNLPPAQPDIAEKLDDAYAHGYSDAESKYRALMDKDGCTIYRQAAIDIVVFECGKWTGLAKEISKQLKQLPSAQPERPKGHWIFDFAHNEMTCSECGRTFTGGFDLENADNFCRHCGSDNRGEQDE